MKLYISRLSFQNVKPLIIVEISGLEVEIEEFEPEDEEARFAKYKFPLLEIDRNTFIQSTNAICRYFLKKVDPNNILDIESEEWLEWESSKLQPYVHSVIHQYLTSSKVDKKLSECLLSCLEHLEQHMQDAAIEKNQPGLASLAIWSTLYPLTMDKTLYSEYLAKFDVIQKWHLRLAQTDAIGIVIEKVFCGLTIKECKKYWQLIPVPLLPLSKTMETSDAPDQELPMQHEEINSAFKHWEKGMEGLPTVKPQRKPVLPLKGEKNVLITSALPYVNNVPHLGNIIGSVLSADVFARFCRACQYNTLFVCGTDEYGTATETKALEEGITVNEICNKYFKLHSEVYQWFQIGFDHFGRTTTEKQTQIAQDIFWRLHKEKCLLENSVEQLFCCKCGRFLADRFVEGSCPFCLYEDARGDQCDKCGKLINAPELKSPRCKVCRETPVMKSSRHLFLDLPKLEPLARDWFEKVSENGHWSSTAKVITAAWLKEGLKPRCITRDLKWGTPVPLEGFTDKVFYVWFDAPIGYLSISANYTDKWEEWWKQPDQVELYQFMAKDNVPFHSIIFPCTVLGSKDNYVKVKHLSAVEYLNYEDTKFSKSRGIGVFGNDAKHTGIPSDIWRFYLLYIRPESQDTSFNWNDLMTKANSELLNNLGNFVNRALMFINNNFNRTIPEITLNEDDKILLALINREVKCYIDLMEKLRLRDAIKHILNISRLGNQHIQSNKPWEKVKGTLEEKKRSGSVMGLCANIACLLATLLQPYMPTTSETLKAQLNSPPTCHIMSNHLVCFLPPGHCIGKPSPLFKKIEQSLIDELKKKYAGRQTSPAKEPALKKEAKSSNLLVNGDPGNLIASPEEIQQIQNLVTQQGHKVRELKAAKANKAEVDKEVAVLLELKRQLATASGQNFQQMTGKGNKKKK